MPATAQPITPPQSPLNLGGAPWLEWPRGIWHLVLELLLVGLGLALWADVPAPPPPGPQPSEILILTSYGDGRPGVEEVLRGFMASLTEAGISVDRVFTENLDLERGKGEDFRKHLAGTLRLKYAGRSLAVVYVLEQPALGFLLEDLPDVAPGIPVILVRALLPGRLAATGHPFVRQLVSYDLAGTIQHALELFPGTRRMLFVAGSTDSDRAVAAEATAVLKARSSVVVAEDTTGLSLAAVKGRIAHPPPDTVLMVLPFNRDGEGQTAVQMEVAQLVSRTAEAPVFTLWETVLGQGAVGGSVTNFFEVGRQAGAFSADLVQGRRTLTQPVTDLPSLSFPRFDWVQIQRWHGQPGRLPLTSVFLNRPVSLWEQHRRTVLLAMLFLVAQSVLILLLLLQRRLRNAAQVDLSASEARFRILVEEAPEAILVFDLAANQVVEANVKAERLFGVSRETLKDSGIVSYYAVDQPDGMQPAASFKANSERALAGESVLVERHILNALGEHRICELRLVRLPSAKHPILRASLIDITERRRAEAEAAASYSEANNFRKALDHIAAYIYIKDRKGRYVYANRPTLELFGCSAEALRGSDDTQYFPAETCARLRAVDKRVLEQGEETAEEIVIETLDGRVATYWEVKAPLFEEGDRHRIWGLCGISTDLTDVRRLEEERNRLTSQLHQSQKLESLGSLAGGVAHDLNNVLGAILGLSSSFRRRLPEDDPLARALETISSACLRGRGVVKSLLYFARKDLDQVGPVDFNEIAREVVGLLESTTLKKVQLRLELQGQLPLMQGDAGALSHALVNICVNAVDAMSGAGSLRIHTATRPDGWLEIGVKDSGPGMSHEVASRVLEPFFSTKAVGQGTGLGLPMVYGTVQAHGGTLDIRTAPGEGTEVLMAFPCPKEEAVLAPATPQLAQVEASGGLRVLVVDDDELIRMTMEPMLEVMGHKVQSVGGGREAIAQLADGLEVDLVILDMNMPDLSGAETLPKLLELRPGLRVLLASGYSDEGTAHLLVNRPSVASIRKPFTLEELQAKLASMAGPHSLTTPST